MTKKSPEVLTFGCRLNSAESETMLHHAQSAGLDNTVIINTCAVTAEAERQAGQTIRRLKRENPDMRIIVTGCAAQIDPNKYAMMSEVETVIDNKAKLHAESFYALSGGKPPQKADLALPPALAAMQRAFIQVQNGCDNRCTFCIIPFGRGESRSLSFEAIADQVSERVAEGYQELVLTGVDIASYGKDLPGEPSLGFMVRYVLDKVQALPRLRLSSLDPAAIDEDLWDVIADEARLMPHLHLSLQAGDDMILKRMKRRHSAKDVIELCERARRLRPDIVFGADVIAGFPTETDAMFDNTYGLVQDCDITWLHVFPYSARKGTPAARMPQVPMPIRKTRAESLRVLGDAASRNHRQGLVGKNLSVLVEKNGWGCTPHFAKVKIKGTAPIGQIVDVKAVGMEDGEVMAEYAGKNE